MLECCSGATVNPCWRKVRVRRSVKRGRASPPLQAGTALLFAPDPLVLETARVGTRALVWLSIVRLGQLCPFLDQSGTGGRTRPDLEAAELSWPLRNTGRLVS
jgi:hypothetical protein